jgi:hypothetical protein
VFASANPITQENVGSATPVPVTAVPRPAGSHEVLIVPRVPGTSFFCVRAVDHAGNIGPLPL